MKPAPTRPSLRISKETFLTMRGATGFERVREQFGVYAERVAACLRTDPFLRKHRSKMGAEAMQFGAEDLQPASRFKKSERHAEDAAE